MKLLFWRKIPEPIILIVPEEKVLGLLELWDRYVIRTENDCKTERYDLWKYIEDLFPEVKSGGWAIKFTGPTDVHIVKNEKD